MKRTLLFALVATTFLVATNSLANAQAYIALHLQSVTGKVCSSPIAAPCPSPTATGANPIVDGELNTGYNAYLIVIGFDINEGIIGTRFGLDYGPNITVGSWTSCSDLEFPSPLWPATGSGTNLNWATCQNTENPATPNYGLANGGTFYVYAYGNEYFRITPNLTGTPDTHAGVANCANMASDVPDSFTSALGFGNINGYDPCIFNDTESCAIPCVGGTPVEETTWGGLKRVVGNSD